MLTGREPWVLNEMAYAGRENLDAAHVARYDRKEDADPGGEVEALLASGLGGDATVVDLGAGTGQFTLAVAPNVGRVVAVDVSPVMLEHLRAKLANVGVGNVECVQSGFLTYDHAGAAADLVYSRYALHHLPDFWKVLTLRGSRACSDPGASCVWSTSCTASTQPTRRPVWNSGCQEPLRARSTRAGPEPSSKSTFATEQHLYLAARTDDLESRASSSSRPTTARTAWSPATPA